MNAWYHHLTAGEVVQSYALQYSTKDIIAMIVSCAKLISLIFYLIEQTISCVKPIGSNTLINFPHLSSTFLSFP